MFAKKNTFAHAIHRCAMEDEIAHGCKKPRRADSWQPRALATRDGDGDFTGEMKGATMGYTNTNIMLQCL